MVANRLNQYAAKATLGKCAVTQCSSSLQDSTASSEDLLLGVAMVAKVERVRL